MTRRVARGAMWMVLLRIAIRGLSVVSQLILVRLLTPADFGVAAAATVAASVLDGLTETSINLALVQMRTPQRFHYHTAWTMSVLRGLLVGSILWFMAPLMADYMRDERVADVMRVLAITPVMLGFESIGMARLQRELRFNRIFIYQLSQRCIAFVVALPLAFIYRNYWALVLGGVVARAAMLPLSYVIGPMRPGLSLRGFRDMFNFSKLLLLTNFLTMADVFMIPMIMGRVGTLRDIGMYQVSRDLASLPASEIAAPIRGPMFAGYSRVADDGRALRHQIISGLGFLVMIIVPMSAGIAVTAPFVVSVALGPQWTDAGPVLTLAALYALVDAIGHMTGGVFLARNAQAPYVSVMAGCLVLRLALVLPAAMWGGLAWAMAMMVVSGMVSAALWYSRMRKLVTLSWADLGRPVWRTLMATAVMVASVGVLEVIWPQLPDPTARAFQWAAVCGCGAIIHVATQYALWRLSGCPEGPEAQLIRRLMPRVTALVSRVNGMRRPAA